MKSGKVVVVEHSETYKRHLERRSENSVRIEAIERLLGQSVNEECACFSLSLSHWWNGECTELFFLRPANGVGAANRDVSEKRKRRRRITKFFVFVFFWFLVFFFNSTEDHLNNHENDR